MSPFLNVSQKVGFENLVLRWFYDYIFTPIFSGHSHSLFSHYTHGFWPDIKFSYELVIKSIFTSEEFQLLNMILSVCRSTSNLLGQNVGQPQFQEQSNLLKVLPDETLNHVLTKIFVPSLPLRLHLLQKETLAMITMFERAKENPIYPFEEMINPAFANEASQYDNILNYLRGHPMMRLKLSSPAAEQCLGSTFE